MARTHFRAYPPYTGTEPFLYLCFHETDARRVKPLIDGLYKRNCRVWYSLGTTLDPRRSRERSERMRHASLMVLLPSGGAADDESMKSAVGFYQDTGGRVICVESERLSPESGLALLFTDKVRRIRAADSPTTEELVSTLMRTEGFSQELIDPAGGERRLFRKKRRVRRAALSVLAAALALSAATVFYAANNNWFRPEPVIEDTVLIRDETIREAARSSLSPSGGAALTEESLAQITTLHFSAMPASMAELSLFPALTRIEIPQAAVAEAAALVEDGRYTVVVYGEAAE